MRNAPSVSYPVGRCAFHGCLLLLTGLAAAVAGVLWWLLSWAPPGWLGGLGVGVWAIWAALALRSWRRVPTGCLQWDAHASADTVRTGNGCWRWSGSEGEPVLTLDTVQTVLDAQGVMLLRLTTPAGPCQWVWVDRARDLARWDDLRRALKGHAI